MKRAFPSTAATAFFLIVSVAATSSGENSSHPVESVTVASLKALPGIWKFPPRERQAEWTHYGAKFLLMGPEMYCRVGLEGAGHTFNCLELAERSAQAKLDADISGKVFLSWRFLWGVPACRWVFNGRLESNTEMSGSYGSVCPVFGADIYRWRPGRMAITKITLAEHGADAGGQATLLKHLIEEMGRGPVTEPYAPPHFVSSNPNVRPLPDDVQQKLLVFLTADELRRLGPIAAVIYIGDYFPTVGWWFEQAPPPPTPPPGFHDAPVPIVPLAREVLHNNPVYGDKRPVYAVEFENGERLCTLHQRPDGVLDQFQCI